MDARIDIMQVRFPEMAPDESTRIPEDHREWFYDMQLDEFLFGYSTEEGKGQTVEQTMKFIRSMEEITGIESNVLIIFSDEDKEAFRAEFKRLGYTGIVEVERA